MISTKRMRVTSAMFFTHLLIAVMVSTFSIMVIFLIKKWFQSQLSAKWNYHIWHLLFIILAIPLLPRQLLNFGPFFHLWNPEQASFQNSSVNQRSSQVGESTNWFQDFSVSVNRADITWFSTGLAALWCIGALIFIILALQALRTIRKIRIHSSSIENEIVLQLFEECKQQLEITKPIKVVVSPLVTSPLTFGVFRTYVVLPPQFEEWLSLKEIQFIFLHELIHYKNKDIWVNYVMVIYQIIYWYNPLVWFASKEMRLDREIACDKAVLDALGDQARSEYGHTILRFIDRTIRKQSFSLATQLNGSKEQIKKRIQQIAAYTSESKGREWRSVLIFFLVIFLVASQLPVVSALAKDYDHYRFNQKNVTYEDLEQYFTGYEGSFVLYDQNEARYRIYNEDKSTERVSPNSTYKIYSALFALEANVITRNSSTLPWDGIEYPFESWNHDHDVASALKNSVNWYFQHLDRNFDLQRIESNLERIRYGNTNVTGGIDSFWIESTLEISPIEQVEILHNFYNNSFGFQKQNVDMIKQALRLEEKDGAQLYGKTGTGSVNGKNVNGWFVGYVEAADNTYFFATNIQNEDKAAGSNAIDITLSILAEKGIY